MSHYSSTSKPQLPYLLDQEFEDEAALLLTEFGNHHGHVTAPPIPIDEITEAHLKLAVEFRDLLAEYPEGDVHGAIWFHKRCIAIDQSLVPEENPAMRGRYRFTLAHEVGHWRLHRHLYLKPAGQGSLLDTDAKPDFVLRSKFTDPKEYQANRFASCLLMPRDMVKRAWAEWRGEMEPIYLDDLQAERRQILTLEALRRGRFKSGDDAIENMLLEHASRPLAERFEVSPDAMRIRLEGMKLLQRKKEAMLF